VIAIIIGGVACLGAAQPAQAAAPQLSITPTAGPPGTRVTVTGTGFCPAPCTPASIDFGGDTVEQAVNVTATGTFRVAFTVPTGTPGGTNTVYAEQNDSASHLRQASTHFAITPSVPAPNTSVAKSSTRPVSPVTSNPTTSKSLPRTSTPTTATPMRTTARSATPTAAPRTASTPATRAASHDSGGRSAWWIAAAAALIAAMTGGTVWWRRRPTSSG
jgi:hypothetical protein